MYELLRGRLGYGSLFTKIKRLPELLEAVKPRNSNHLVLAATAKSFKLEKTEVTVDNEG
jgi:hypothetical protein